jgi:hypothetical protein
MCVQVARTDLFALPHSTRRPVFIMDFPPPPLTKITQYPPANESAAGLVDERTSLAGSELAMFAYGKRRIHAVFVWC